MNEPEPLFGHCFMDRAKAKKRCEIIRDDPQKRALFPWGGPVLLFSTVKSHRLGAGQRVRLGFWNYIGVSAPTKDACFEKFQDGKMSFEKLRAITDRPFESNLNEAKAARNGGTASGPLRWGVFYNQAFCTEAEIETIKQFAQKNDMGFADLQGFIHCVLLHEHGSKNTANEAKLICGFGLENELASVALACPRDQSKQGFTLRFCDCLARIKRGERNPKGGPIKCRHPYFRVKPMGGDFVYDKINPRVRDEKNQLYRFLDIRRMSVALGAGFEFKGKIPPGDLSVTAGNLALWRGDVNDLCAAYKRMRDIYKSWNLDTPIWNLFSGASLAKAMFGKFNFVPFLEQNPDFDWRVLGIFQFANFAARADVKITYRIVEVLHVDFRAEYPAAASLMNVQGYLRANKVRAIPNTPNSLKFLQSVTYDELFKREVWPKLMGAAKVHPNDDVLPFNGKMFEIVKASGEPYWVTFADVAASKILTGKTPQIIETITLSHEGIQPGLRPYALLEQGEQIDPAKGGDLFARLVELREKIKKGDGGVAAAIKLAASSGAYGIFGELNSDARKRRSPVTVYSGGAASDPLKDNRLGKERKALPVEIPGTWFAPFAACVTGAGRLLLAMLEKAGADRGIDYAACDTDAMVYARPENMGREDFQSKVREIQSLLEALSPYRDGKHFLKIEDQCFKLIRPGEVDRNYMEPLLFLSLGTKRYAEFNSNDSHPIIRHVAAIGLGEVREPPSYNPDDHPFTAGPHPAGYSEDVCHATASRVIMDTWRHVARRFERGEEDELPFDFQKIKALDSPAYRSVQIVHAAEVNLYKGMPGYRPLMPLIRIDREENDEGAEGNEGSEKNLIAAGSPAVDGLLILPEHEKFILDPGTWKAPSRLRFKKLSAFFKDYFHRWPDSHLPTWRRSVIVGDQFVISKGHSDKKDVLFRIDGEVLVPHRRAPKEQENIFLKLSRMNKLKEFYYSFAMFSANPKSPFHNTIRAIAMNAEAMAHEHNQESVAYSLCGCLLASELVERACAFHAKILTSRLDPQAAAEAAAIKRQENARERAAQFFRRSFQAAMALSPELPDGPRGDAFSAPTFESQDAAGRVKIFEGALDLVAWEAGGLFRERDKQEWKRRQASLEPAIRKERERSRKAKYRTRLNTP
jgi:hypothetical protein